MPRIAITATLVAVLALGACSDGSDEPDAGPSSPAAPGTSGSPSSSSPGDPASEEPSSDVEPATGVRLQMPLSSVRAPADWQRSDFPVDTLTGAGDDDTSSLLSLGEIDAFGGTPSASELGDTALTTNPYRFDPKKLPETELDGVEVYHLAGKILPLTYLEEFGAVVDDRIVTLRFEFSSEVTPAERREVVDAVTASFAWK